MGTQVLEELSKVVLYCLRNNWLLLPVYWHGLDKILLLTFSDLWPL